jgi:UDP-glucose 4-epimerase
MKTVVTGGAGMIGSHEDTGCEILVLDFGGNPIWNLLQARMNPEHLSDSGGSR